MGFVDVYRENPNFARAQDHYELALNVIYESHTGNSNGPIGVDTLGGISAGPYVQEKHCEALGGLNELFVLNDQRSEACYGPFSISAPLSGCSLDLAWSF